MATEQGASAGASAPGDSGNSSRRRPLQSREATRGDTQEEEEGLTAVPALPFSHFWTLRVTAARRSAATRCSSLRAWRVARAATETYLLKLLARSCV